VTDWTADDILAGKPQLTTEQAREVMDNPEQVTLVIKGRNGHRIEWRVPAGERGLLSVTQGYERDDPFVDQPFRREFPHEIHPPEWQRYTWTVTRHLSYRAEDFLP
jgi:hypothetical protein